MDTITHGIAGALVARSLGSRHTPQRADCGALGTPRHEARLATIAVTLGAVFPDSDFFAHFFSNHNLARLELHRGVTHSFLMLPVWALLFGGITWFCTRRRWLLWSGLYGAGLALHIFLDLITSYGTMIWAPWSNARVAWDLAFIVDLTLTGIVLLPQLMAWVYSSPEQALRRGLIAWFVPTLVGAVAAWLAAALQIPLPVLTVVIASAGMALLLWLPSLEGRGFRWPTALYCRLGVMVLVVYLVLCRAAHQAALSRVEDFAQSTGSRTVRWAALPAPPSLWWWSGLVQTPEGIYRVSIRLLDPAAPSYRFFANAEKNVYLEKAEAHADVQTFRWFARFPWVTYREESGLHVIEYRDLQFFDPPRGRTPPFTLRVFLDDQGRVVRSGLLQP